MVNLKTYYIIFLFVNKEYNIYDCNCLILNYLIVLLLLLNTIRQTYKNLLVSLLMKLEGGAFTTKVTTNLTTSLVPLL